jgi:hypothetical protein
MTPYQIYWSVWSALIFVTFLPVELYAVISGNYLNTLSWSFWDLESFEPGSTAPWTWNHWLVGTVIFLFLTWLAFHLVFGWWNP